MTIETTMEAVDYVGAFWSATHAAHTTIGIPSPYCCTLTRLTMLEMALEHELGFAKIVDMNHAEAAAVMIDLMRRGLEQVSSESVDELLRHLDWPAEDGHDDGA